MNNSDTLTSKQPSLWRQALLQPGVWKRAMILGLPIGLLQAVINQGDIWWRHAADAAVVAKTIISPLVTFSVALLSAAATWIERKRTTLDAPTQLPPNVINHPQHETRNYDRIEI